MNSHKKVVAITGASNGMGEAAAKLFATKGWIVYGGARRVKNIPSGENMHSLYLDVNDSASNQQFIHQIMSEQGRIDVLINNAGYGEYGPIEDMPLEAVRKQFETNFFGAIELTQLVLPIMRQQKNGRIINISSIGGDLYMPLGAYYHATKAALQQWSDVLNTEVSEFGISSIIIQPGGTKSAWGEIAMTNAQKNLKQGSVYYPLVDKFSKTLTSISERGGATSEDLAQLFYKAATDKKPKRRYFNGFSDRVIVHIARAHPQLFKNILSLIIKRS